jgi:hypothetical protein
MTPLELMRDAINKEFRSEDGDSISLKLQPGLSESEIAKFESSLPCPLPQEIRDLVRFCRGFDDLLESVDFTGLEGGFGLESIFPYGLPMAHDGYGNYWVVDLLPESKSFGPIYFACHDAPVILFQSSTIENFLLELFKMFTPPFKSQIDDVHEDRIFEVWRKNPRVLSQEECLLSQDPQLSAFAKELDSTFQIVDLRSPSVGFGFSWGRYGPNTVVRRFGTEPIFAYQKKTGLLKKLFGAT